MIIQEVAPRDGLQIEQAFVPTDEKIRLIDQLSRLGFSRIEVSSFVSPRAVPNLRDAADVFAGIERSPATTYVALVANPKGAEHALVANADEINLVISASESHNVANTGMSCMASLAALDSILALMRPTPTTVNVTIATAFGCPFEGAQPQSKIRWLVDHCVDRGVDGLTLADTTGMANPRQVTQLVQHILAALPSESLTLHFHDTRGLGFINVLAAWEAGACRFDASLGGTGGCPFAPDAAGNVCTEDLVNLCREIGIVTNLDLNALIVLARRLTALLGHDIAGHVARLDQSCQAGVPSDAKLTGPLLAHTS